MSRHHRIIVPAVTDRPTCAGEWEYKGAMENYLDSTRCQVTTGYWYYCRRFVRVLVTETPAAGRFCRELRMGGSIHCGLDPWSGQWRKVG